MKKQITNEFVEEFAKLARSLEADIIGVASADRFAKDDPIFKVFPKTKSVIGLAFRVLRGSYRGVKEGSTYYQYTTMGVETIEETVMPMAAIRLSNLIEEQGYLAIPERKVQLVMPSGMETTNPEVEYNDIYRNRPQEVLLDYLHMAVTCGLGEESMIHSLLTDEFGPMVRYFFILTDAIFPETKPVKPHLCDGCKACIAGCPGHAISEDGTMDSWRCAVYYNGASGLKNPFMPKDAYQEFEDRLDIINGNVQNLTPEKAQEIINETFFYPPIKQSYPSSICGRACDMACYDHLEKAGKLTKKFRDPFDKGREWAFKIEDFQ